MLTRVLSCIELLKCLCAPELQPKNSKHISTNDCSFEKNNSPLLKPDTYLAGQPECAYSVCVCVCVHMLNSPSLSFFTMSDRS